MVNQLFDVAKGFDNIEIMVKLSEFVTLSGVCMPFVEPLLLSYLQRLYRETLERADDEESSELLLYSCGVVFTLLAVRNKEAMNLLIPQNLGEGEGAKLYTLMANVLQQFAAKDKPAVNGKGVENAE